MIKRLIFLIHFPQHEKRGFISLMFFFRYVAFAGTIPISIYSPDFSSKYISNWSLNGTSTIIDGKVLQLTPSTGGVGTAFWTGKVCNADAFKFSAFFSFKITPSSSSIWADGITFIIQQYSSLYGSNGAGLGYDNIPGKSIAIEYDTYENIYTYNGDQDNNHIAIDFGGCVNHTTNANTTGISDLVASNQVLSNLGIILADTKIKYSWIDYDGTTLQVRISNTSDRPTTPLLSIKYNLESYFDGASVYYGFGGATGSFLEQNLIYSAYINNHFKPIDITKNTYSQIATSTSSLLTDSICQGETYSFNGITYTTSGTYTANLTNAAGCDSIATLVLTVNKPSSSTKKVSICQGETYRFNGNAYSSKGTYMANLTNVAGCDSTATLILTVNKPDSSTLKVSICQGEICRFNGNAYSSAGTYTANLTNVAGCDSTATLILTVNQPSSSNITESICDNESYSFNGKNLTSAGTYTAHLANAMNCDSTVTLMLDVKKSNGSITNESICEGETYWFNGNDYALSGTYPVILMNAIGCDSTATLVLKVNDNSSSITNATIELGDSYLFNGTTYSEEGTYIVNSTTTAGCDSIATLNLKVHIPIIAPDFFTPNGDGYHDTWEIENIVFFPNADIFIFDRFGKPIIHYKGSDKGWDGKFSGKVLSSDDYWYIIDLNDGNKPYKGHFTLVGE